MASSWYGKEFRAKKDRVHIFKLLKPGDIIADVVEDKAEYDNAESTCNSYYFVEFAGPNENGVFICSMREVALDVIDRKGNHAYVSETFTFTENETPINWGSSFYKVTPGSNELPKRGPVPGAVRLYCDA